jgi:hypothetical protein
VQDVNSSTTRTGFRAIVKAVALALAVLCCSVSACRSHSGESDRASSGGSAWAASFDGGRADVGRFVMGFREDDIPIAELAGIRTYSVPAGEPIPMTYHGLSSLPGPAHLRITLLIDLQQVTFTLDDEASLLHDVVLQPQVIRDMPIIIPALEEGPHDVIWLAFFNPDEHSAEEECRFSSTDGSSDRFSLLAGAAQLWDQVDAERLGSFEVEGREGCAECFPTHAFMTSEEDVMRAWFEEEVSPGERLDYYIFTRYEALLSPSGSGTNIFAILVFLDYELIPLSVGDDRLVRYFSIEPDTAGVRIEASLVAPDEPGPHELCALRVNNPNRRADGLSLCRECSSFALYAYLERRTLITVR